jgi:serine/threonine protein kinase
MEQLVGRTLNRYKITDLLGEGGMGAVFKATDVTLQREVAVKIMHPHTAKQPNFRERFLQEARTAARLDHPSIVQVYDFGQERSLLYIVMEFIPGANLRDMLQDLKAQGKWIPLDEAVNVIHHLSRAMHYAHEHGVLHRDLKPSNVMIEPEATLDLPYRPVLTDLGLAKLMEGQRITRAGTSMGTPTYMSPEQAQGEDTDARSDVYALGVMLYELAVGEPPFPVRTLTEAIRYHTKEPPPPPRSVKPDLPAHIDQVILKALEKDPEKRWKDAGALAEALEGGMGAVKRAAVQPTAVEQSISLMTQYQQSLSQPRGPSILDEFKTPSGNQEVIQCRLPGGQTKNVPAAGDIMTIGRAEENDIVLETSNVSREHARLEFDGGRCRVIDLDSTNGTFIGGARLLPGVPEPWDPDQPLRVGDVWMKRVPASVGGFQSESSSTSPRGPSVAPSSAQREIDRNMLRSSSGEGRVGVVMEETQLSVDPGSTVTSTMTLLNQGPTVDHFEISERGVPDTWVQLPDTVRLMPGQQQEVSIVIRPQRSPQSRAGRYALTFRVTSRNTPSQVVEVKAALTVTPYIQFSSSIQPQKIRSNQRVNVRIQNQSNIPETFIIRGQDRADALTFDPPQAQIRVDGGKDAQTQVRIKPHRRRWFGRPETLPFTLEVGGGYPPSAHRTSAQTHTGELVSRPRIPTWVPIVLLLLLTGLVSAAGLLISRPPVFELAEIDPLRPEAGQPVTVRWRVRRAQSVELRPLGIEVNPDRGEYTFTEGFEDTTEIVLVASNMFRSIPEPLSIPVTKPIVEPILEFWSVFPSEITQGQEVTIEWRTRDAESVVIEPFGTVEDSGQIRDDPQQTRTYRIILTNDGRRIEKAEEVLVATPAPNAPVIRSFTVDPASIIAGEVEEITLTWDTEETDIVTIEPGLGPVGLAGERKVEAPNADTTYTLIAKNAAQETRAQVQLLVRPPADLAITLASISIKGYTGGCTSTTSPLELSICVRNEDEGDAGPFTVTGGGETWDVSGLSAGQEECLDPREVAGGSTEVLVDPDDQVVESDEDNNVMMIPVPTPPPVCPTLDVGAIISPGIILKPTLIIPVFPINP